MSIENQTIALIANAQKNAKNLVHEKGDSFVLVSTKVSGIGGVYRLKDVKISDHSGIDISDIEAINKPTIEVVPGDALSFTTRARDSLKAVMRTYGFALSSGMNLIRMSDIKPAYEEMMEIGKTFKTDTDNFIQEYDVIIEEQQMLFPDIAKIIHAIAPKKEKLSRCFRFKISPPIALSIDAKAMGMVEDIVGKTTNPLDSVFDELVTSISREAYHFWRYSLQSAVKAVEDKSYRSKFIDPNCGRYGLRSSCIATLKNLRDKIANLAKVEPRFSRIVDVLDTMASLLPQGYQTNNGLIKDINVVKVLINTFNDLRNEDYIHHLINSSSETSELTSKAVEELTSETSEQVVTDLSKMFINLDNDVMTDTKANEAEVTVEATDGGLDDAATIAFETKPKELLLNGNFINPPYEELVVTPEPEVTTQKPATKVSFGDDLFADF